MQVSEARLQTAEECRWSLEATLKASQAECEKLRSDLVDEANKTEASAEAVRNLERELDLARKDKASLQETCDNALASFVRMHNAICTEAQATVGGVGIVVRAEEGKRVKVKSLIEGGSAALSGQVKAGDVIVKVDNREVHGLSFRAFQGLLLGAPGTKVSIVGVREKDGQRYDVILIRNGTVREGADLAEEGMAAAKVLREEIEKMRVDVRKLGDELSVRSEEMEKEKSIRVRADEKILLLTGKNSTLEKHLREKESVLEALQKDLSEFERKSAMYEKEKLDLESRLKASEHSREAVNIERDSFKDLLGKARDEFARLSIDLEEQKERESNWQDDKRREMQVCLDVYICKRMCVRECERVNGTWSE